MYNSALPSRKRRNVPTSDMLFGRRLGMVLNARSDSMRETERKSRGRTSERSFPDALMFIVRKDYSRIFQCLERIETRYSSLRILYHDLYNSSLAGLGMCVALKVCSERQPHEESEQATKARKPRKRAMRKLKPGKPHMRGPFHVADELRSTAPLCKST